MCRRRSRDRLPARRNILSMRLKDRRHMYNRLRLLRRRSLHPCLSSLSRLLDSPRLSRKHSLSLLQRLPKSSLQQKPGSPAAPALR